MIKMLSLTTLQKEIIDKRSASIKDKTAKTIPWEKIEIRLKERFGL